VQIYGLTQEITKDAPAERAVLGIVAGFVAFAASVVMARFLGRCRRKPTSNFVACVNGSAMHYKHSAREMKFQ
jgi:hypothetical protein